MSNRENTVVVVDPNRTVVGMMTTVLAKAGLEVRSFKDLADVQDAGDASLFFVNLSADPSRVMELGGALGNGSVSERVIVTTVTPALIETFCPPGQERPFAEVMERPFSPGRLIDLCQKYLEQSLEVSDIVIEEAEPRDQAHWDALGERLLTSGEFDVPEGTTPDSATPDSASARRRGTPRSGSRSQPQQRGSGSGRLSVGRSSDSHPIVSESSSPHDAQTVAGPTDSSPVMDAVDVDETSHPDQTRAAPFDTRRALDSLHEDDGADGASELEDEVELPVIDIALETGDGLEAPPDDMATSDAAAAVKPSDMAEINSAVDLSVDEEEVELPAYDPADSDASEAIAPESGEEPIQSDDSGDFEDLSEEAVVVPDEDLALTTGDIEELDPELVLSMDESEVPAEPELDDVPPPAPAMPAHLLHNLEIHGAARLWPLRDVLQHARKRAIQGAIEVYVGETQYTLLVDGPLIRWCEPHRAGAFVDFGSVLVTSGVVSEEAVAQALTDPAADRTPLIELLVDREVATSEAIYEALLWQVTQWVWDAMSLVDSQLSLTIQLASHQSALAEGRPLVQLDSEAACFEFFRRFPEFLPMQYSFAGMRLVSRAEVAERVAPNGLAPEEEWVIERLSDPRSVDGLLEIASDSGMNVDLILSVVHRLREFDILVPG